MSQVRFEVADAAGIRFGISPLWETVRSLYALADPGRHWPHRPWVRAVRQLASNRDLARSVELLRAFAHPGAWLPDFLTPRPAGPIVELEDELAVLAATPPEVVAADLTATTAKRPLTRLAAATLADPAGTLPLLVDAARTWHRAAIAPYWPQMRALLDADIAFRARQLAEGGATRLFDTLHPTVRWAGDRIIADDPWDIDLDLRGRGLPLVPSVFVDRRVLWNVRADSPPVAVYPARSVATLWRRPVPASPGLAAVLGTTRARLLAMVRDPATTTGLALRTGLSPAAVSQHLHTLHAAGLITRSRHGRSVRYLATGAGRLLLTINGISGDPECEGLVRPCGAGPDG